MVGGKGFSQSQRDRQEPEVLETQRGPPTAAITGSQGCLDGLQQIRLSRQQISGKRGHRSIGRSLSGVGHRSFGKQWPPSFSGAGRDGELKPFGNLIQQSGVKPWPQAEAQQRLAQGRLDRHGPEHSTVLNRS